jgi:hypothetical protein
MNILLIEDDEKVARATRRRTMIASSASADRMALCSVSGLPTDKAFDPPGVPLLPEGNGTGSVRPMTLANLLLGANIRRGKWPNLLSELR